ncbi:MAG: thioredoxin family protein [Pseudomonadota bacterium]
MKKRIRIAALALVALLVIAGALKSQLTEYSPDANAAEPQVLFKGIPRKGTVTMLDLGADSCIPCKMMAPIMKKLEKDYKGRADILFIDVWKNPEQAKRFKVRAIPTQIFFNKEGNEVERHVGFLKEGAIVEKLKSLGVE